MTQHAGQRRGEDPGDPGQGNQLGQAFEDATAALGPAEGADESGTISVQLDVDGRVSRVTVDADWRRYVAPELLSAAVLAAITKATGERMSKWAEAFAESEETNRGRPPRPLPVHDDFAARLTEAAGGRIDETALVDLIGSLDAAFDDATRLMEAVANAEYAARSPSGHVWARCHVSGQVMELRFDEGWLETAHDFNIGRETTDAVTAAHRKATATSLQAAFDASALGQLQKILSDPEALGRALRRT